MMRRRLRAYIDFGTLVWNDDEAFLAMMMKIDGLLIALPQAQSYSYASNYQLIVRRYRRYFQVEVRLDSINTSKLPKIPKMPTGD
jgi:hypothetical protein